MTTEVMQAYSSGVLKPEVHGRLVMNLGHYAQRANIMESYVLHKMSKFECTPQEIAYVRSMKRQAEAGIYGLIYHGAQTKPIMPRMSAVAGACVRNFVEAKVVMLRDLLIDIKNGTPPDVSVLLLPNFFNNHSEGGRIAEWDIAELLGLLYARMAKGQQTFLYVSDFEALKKTYGTPIAQHLKHTFRTVEA